MDAALDDPGPGRLTATDTDLLRVEVTVPLGGEAAFVLFTDGAGGWWPAVEGAPVTIAAGEGAAWGPGDHPWGAVTLCEPPTRLRLSWATDDGHSTVDVRVAEVDDDLTTVIVEHRGLGHHGPDERAWLRGDDGWWSILRAYAAAARDQPDRPPA